MSYNNNLQREADQVGYFDSNEESEMFAKRLVSAISKGNDHISLTLTEKGAIAFARELSECILAEKAAQTTDKQEDDSALLTKQEVMDRLDVSCTTLRKRTISCQSKSVEKYSIVPVTSTDCAVRCNNVARAFVYGLNSYCRYIKS